MTFGFGRKTGKDIDLPLEPGHQRDPRLPAKPPSLMNSLRTAGKGYKLLRDKGLVGQRTPSKR